MEQDEIEHDIEDEEEYSILLAVRDMLRNTRELYRTIRFVVPGTQRGEAIIANEITNRQILSVLRAQMAANQAVRYTVNIPLANMSANMPLVDPAGSRWEDPVPIIPTVEQLAAGTEHSVQAPENTTCSICQEGLTRGERLRHCGHFFHADCIGQWFTMSPRCPMCRHDIRGAEADSSSDRSEVVNNRLESLLRTALGHIDNLDNDRRMHPD
jgi:hypothetical protein